MFEYVKKNKILAATGGLALIALVTAPVMAQRNPAYQAARTSGAVGEKPDGYLGYVKSPTPAVKAVVEHINIKRKAAYTRKAQQTNSTVEQFAFTSGCNLISRTVPGEKYQTPTGNWDTRAGSAPVRDSRCP